MFDCVVVAEASCINFSKSGKELFKVRKEKVDCSACDTIVVLTAALHVIIAADADVNACCDFTIINIVSIVALTKTVDIVICIVVVGAVAAVLCVAICAGVVVVAVIIVTVTRFELFKSQSKRFHAWQSCIRAYLDQLLDCSI